MKTRPHPHYDLFDEYPELRPKETREPLIATVKRKVRLPDSKPRRGDVNFNVHCSCGDNAVNLDTGTANPIIAATFVQLLIRDLKPDTIIYKDGAGEVEAILNETCLAVPKPTQGTK